MYTGSADFQAANNQPIQMHKISGTVDGTAFGPENVLINSVRITNQCSDSVDAQIGAVYIGQLEITFLPNIGISPTTWQGREIALNFSLLINETPETWETFSLGVFTVASAERTLQGFSITAYDNMSKFDKMASWDYLPSGTLYSILNDICTECGVTFGMSKADCEAIDQMIIEKEPQFLVGEVIELKVKFTDKGVENFNRQLYMRPLDFDKVEGEDNTYVFRCTEIQAINS